MSIVFMNIVVMNIVKLRFFFCFIALVGLTVLPSTSLAATTSIQQTIFENQTTLTRTLSTEDHVTFKLASHLEKLKRTIQIESNPYKTHAVRRTFLGCGQSPEDLTLTIVPIPFSTPSENQTQDNTEPQTVGATALQRIRTFTSYFSSAAITRLTPPPELRPYEILLEMNCSKIMGGEVVLYTATARFELHWPQTKWINLVHGKEFATHIPIAQAGPFLEMSNQVVKTVLPQLLRNYTGQDPTQITAQADYLNEESAPNNNPILLSLSKDDSNTMILQIAPVVTHIKAVYTDITQP